MCGHNAIADHDLSGGWFNEARDQTQSRGLAATGGSEQADQQSMLDAQRHVIDDWRLVVSLGQIPQLDRRHIDLLLPSPALPGRLGRGPLRGPPSWHERPNPPGLRGRESSPASRDEYVTCR